MKIVHIPLILRESAAWDAQLIQMTGTLILPSFDTIYLMSANCKLSVKDTQATGNPLFYMGSDVYNFLWNSDGHVAESVAKFQGYDADVALRNSDGTDAIVLNEAAYTPVLGHLDGINYNIFINPQGMFMPREPILLNLCPDYTLGIWCNVRYGKVGSLTHNFNVSDIYAYCSLILEFGLE